MLNRLLRHVHGTQSVSSAPNKENVNPQSNVEQSGQNVCSSDENSVANQIDSVDDLKSNTALTPARRTVRLNAVDGHVDESTEIQRTSVQITATECQENGNEQNESAESAPKNKAAEERLVRSKSVDTAIGIDIDTNVCSETMLNLNNVEFGQQNASNIAQASDLTTSTNGNSQNVCPSLISLEIYLIERFGL